jgi:DNA-binding NtrC family response regulator
LKSETVDVMILDLVMPDLHGLDVLDRALQLRPRLVVIVSSVVNAAQSALRAIRRGAYDYFVKPTDPELMEMVVRQLLAARAESAVAIPQPALIAHRVLIVGPDPGFRAALTVALQPRCRVDVADRISVALEMLDTMMPDLTIVDLRSASPTRALGLSSMRVRFPEGPMIVVGAPERINLLLRSSASQAEILVPEPVDYALLFEEIANLMPPNPDVAPLKSLSHASSAAVARVVAQYTDHTLRVQHLAAAAGLSVDHFAHVFSEEMGLPPMDYVARVRTQAAIFMLRETSDKVSTIAKRFGFYDGPHLAMTLRRRGLGKPSDYRRSVAP